jgi:hypothetical protein
MEVGRNIVHNSLQLKSNVFFFHHHNKIRNHRVLDGGTAEC